MTVILHNFRDIKYLINTNNINSVSFSTVDSKQYADEIAEGGGSPLTRIHIDWYAVLPQAFSQLPKWLMNSSIFLKTRLKSFNF